MADKEVCLFEVIDGMRVTWEITHRCNYQCKHCCNDSLDKEYPNELSKQRIFEILDEMVKSGVSAIYFSGGEPLLREDIFEIMSYAKMAGVKRINLASNGGLINPKIAEKLASLKLDSVLMSLDGHLPEVHDKLRGIKGAFEKVINSIRLLCEKGVNVRVGTVIWKRNYPFLEEILKLAVKNGAKSIYFNWLVKSGRCNDNKEILLDPRQYKKVAKEIFRLQEKYAGIIKVGYHRYKKINNQFPSCLGGDRIIHVNTEGCIAPCSWIAKQDPSFVTKDRLTSLSFSELMKSDCLNSFKDMVSKRESCAGKGCPAMCFAENKSFMSTDPLYFDGGIYVR